MPKGLTGTPLLVSPSYSLSCLKSLLTPVTIAFPALSVSRDRGLWSFYLPSQSKM